MHSTTTDAGLLADLCHPENSPAWQAAWRRFETLYRAKIQNGLRRSKKLDEAATEGLTQAILLKLRVEMPKFRYDPRRGHFRGWLFTLVRNQVASFLRADLPKPREIPRGGDDHREAFEQMHDPNANDANGISESIVYELHQDPRLRRMALFRQALESVQSRLRQPNRWEAFWAKKAEGRDLEQVTNELRMTRPAARKAIFDVEQMLKKELESRLNRLLQDAKAGQPSEELSRYAGQTVEQLREQGVQLMAILQTELDDLLEGLTAVATEGRSLTETAKKLKMRPGACGQAADRLGACVDEELSELDSQEIELTGT